MLNNEDELLRLIGDIHVAAADPDRTAWRTALARIGDAFGGVGVMMADHRMPDTIVEFTDAHLPPQLGEYIVANLGSTSTNPMLRSYHRLPIGVPIVSEMMIESAEFER
jgi:hypothetical protein